MIYTLKITTKSGINIRSGPSVSYKRVGGVYKGDTVICDQIEKKSNGETWYKIQGTNNWLCVYRPSVDSFYYATVTSQQITPAPAPVVPTPAPAPKEPSMTVTPVDSKYRYDGTGNYESISGSDIQYGMGFKTPATTNCVDVTYGDLRGKLNIDANNVLDAIQYQKHLTSIKKDLNANYFSSVYELNDRLAKQYNLFDVRFPDYDLKRSFTRIFITRPDLNFFEDDTNSKLCSAISSDPTYHYIYSTHPIAFTELTAAYSGAHDLNFTLSNAARSMEVSDELIDTQEIGETILGFKMIYGKSIHKSMTAGSLNIHFRDDKTLTVYNMISAWVKYISDVYHGVHVPKARYIRDKQLDYASSIYYFVVGEDGETIIYGMKYYGVFPINIPSSNFSKSDNTMIDDVTYNIQFAYSFKDPINILTLAELNYNTVSKGDPTFKSMNKITDARRLFNTRLGHSGNTFVGMPFVSVEYAPDGSKLYKLKFKPN